MRRIVPALFLAIVSAAAAHAQKAAPAVDIHVDVGLVTVTCMVTNHAGVPAKNLSPQDFELRDNGRTQKVDSLWQESELPLTIGLIVDVSGSQGAFVEQHRQTVAKFLAQVIGPKDRAFLVTVGPEVKLVSDITGSVEELRSRLNRIDELQMSGEQFGESCAHVIPLRGCGGTALWNGVYASAEQKLQWVHGRKALIVLSDGFDTGSPHSLADAIESIQESSSVVYAIKYVDPSLTPGQAGISKKDAAARGLERLTDETGGFTFPNPGGSLTEIFSKIENDLRSQYVIGFTPPTAARDGRFHKIEVHMNRKDLSVRARNGYYAATH